MKVALAQIDIAWGDKENNITTVENIVFQTDADIIIFPEMFTTGFMTVDAATYAEPMDGDTIKRLKKIAAQANKAIAGSIIIKVAKKLYNRFIFVKPNGDVEWYDKRHLFSYGNEDSIYTAGNARIIIEYQGVKMLLLICYDLRFPVWSRNRQDYDIAIYIASWPESRMSAWDNLLRARAIENQCYTLGVNRVGSDHSSTYIGHSAAIDYLGNEIGTLADYEKGIINVELNLEALSVYCSKFRAWQDADNFTIDI